MRQRIPVEVATAKAGLSASVLALASNIEVDADCIDRTSVESSILVSS